MSQSIHKCFLVLALWWPPLGALSADHCASKSDDWTCFTAIEIQSAAAPNVRMVIFPTQELLAEIEDGHVTKRYLALPSGIQMYSGLTADESVDPSRKNPFMFLDLGFSLAITALHAAFPLGPASVPGGESKKAILVQGKPITIDTKRSSQRKITYRLESDSIHATGVWENSVQSPLPGTYSLVGWMGPGKTSYGTLQEARAAQLPH